MISHWEQFEMVSQCLLAPLLADTRQKELFLETNKCHERMFFDLVTRIIKPRYFFEIGAYEASTSKGVAHRLPAAICTAFEADPEIHAYFSNKMSKETLPDNFSYIQSAICDYDGEARFQKQVRTEGITPESILPNNSIRQKHSGTYREVVTKCQKIDTFIQDIDGFGDCVLRIDVEGLCHEVLTGSGNALKECRAIYAEVEDYEIWKDQKTVFDIYKLLEDYDFVPVSRDVETPGQYNVLWLNKEDALKRAFRSRLSIYNVELMNIAAASGLVAGRT